MDLFIYFFLQIGFLILSVIIILDIARLATFLFYEKHNMYLPKKNMLKPIVGEKIYLIKNILIVCILIPTFFLIGGILGIGVNIRLSDLKVPFFIIYYSLALISFLLITLASIIGKKLQLEIYSKKVIISLFIIELIMLLILFYLILSLENIVLLK